MQFEPDTSLPCLAGYTILLPCVSVGNVGQLATDVVLATLKPTLVSQVLVKLGHHLIQSCTPYYQAYHPSLIAVCGPNPLSDSCPSLSCAMQLYTHAVTKLAVVQIRSGFLPGKAHQFMADFLTWCKQQQVAKVVSLTSSHAHER